MNLKEIQNLIKFISKTDVDQVKLEFENVKITVSKRIKTQPVTSDVIDHNPTPPKTEDIQTSPKQESESVSKESKTIGNNHKKILSPMLGTLYLKPSPNDPPFVSVGDRIKKGDTLCTIEAMKLFNHINSEYSGKIIEVLVDDSSPVEFSQPLFVIELS